MASSSLYVQVTYRIPLTSKEEGTKEESFEKEEEHSKIFADAPPARLGLPPGVQPCKPEPGEYAYSGMHDAGPLVPPREVDPNNHNHHHSMARLIANVQAAKEYNDQYMTTVIIQTTKTTTTTASSPATKKTKTNTSG